MAVTYYVALPFIRIEDGGAPGEARECQGEAAAGPVEFRSALLALGRLQYARRDAMLFSCK
jgi:hypothetical protein